MPYMDSKCSTLTPQPLMALKFGEVAAAAASKCACQRATPRAAPPGKSTHTHTKIEPENPEHKPPREAEHPFLDVPFVLGLTLTTPVSSRHQRETTRPCAPCSQAPPPCPPLQKKKKMRRRRRRKTKKSSSPPSPAPPGLRGARERTSAFSPRKQIPHTTSKASSGGRIAPHVSKSW